MSTDQTATTTTADEEDPPLRARTLEILWHCNEWGEEAEQLGMRGGGNLVEGITSIDYCPCNGRLVTTGGDRCIRMWQLRPRALRAWLSNSMNDMTACTTHVCTMQTAWMPVTARWSPQGNLVATAHCDGKLCLWWRDRSGGLYQGMEEAAEERKGGSPSSPVSPQQPRREPSPPTVGGGGGGGKGNQGSGQAQQLEEWKSYKHLAGHMNDVYDVAFSPDSRYLISGSGDGSVAIHDLEGSPMPVVQLVDQHRRFCRGVAWDPWNRYLHTFGGGPALQCLEVVVPPPPPQQQQQQQQHTKGRRLHVVSQRKCQGDFIGESCSLSFRRLSWSPDGLFLAVPYGKVPRGGGSADGSDGTTRESVICELIDSKRKEQAAHQQADRAPCQPQSKALRVEAPVAAEGAEDRYPTPSPNNGAADAAARRAGDEGGDASGGSDRDEGEGCAMVHCVAIYIRDAPDRLAARLRIKGDCEVRGVLWAPCFLEPLPPDEPGPLIQRCGGGCEDRKGNANEEEESGSAATLVTAAATDTDCGGGNTGAWGPADYRMALAAWTTDSVVVYTTDSPHRHSDFSDLHMRSITDVAWSEDASFLLTASLDGYVSVIRFGTSLAVAHRLPSFSPRPVTKAIASMLASFAEAGRQRENSRGTHQTMAGASPGNEDGSSKANGSGGSGAAATVAVVRKKKKKEEPTPDDVGLNELTAMMNDAPAG